jgi:hypothetical protein
MNDRLFKLARFLKNTSAKDRSHFYRFRHLLDKKLEEVAAILFLSSEEEVKLATHLSLYSPITENDLSSKVEIQIFRKWKKIFPQDKKFFKMVLKQYEILKRYKDASVKSFLESKEGEEWYRNRRQLNRTSLFELDQPYKKSKTIAIHHEKKVRQLIRNNPLIRWEDLRDLKIKNAQTIFQNFPARQIYRDAFLQKLKTRLAGEESNRKKN